VSAHETWTVGDAYEPYVGRWSRPAARALLDWIAVDEGARWLDVGCGTGALTATILAGAAPTSVLGIDASAAFAAHARRRLGDARASFAIADARNIPAVGPFDAVVSGLVLNFVPQPARAVAEMARVTRDGGVVAAYLWDYAGRMDLMRAFWDAAVALDPAARELDEGRRFPLAQPEPLAALWRAAGLAGVATRALDVPTVFADFDDYWTPFLGGQGPAPSYAMSLTPTARDALRESLRARLVPAPDGTIHLLARAWAVRGHRTRTP
jgi:SAM-dependent methyltransferase